MRHRGQLKLTRGVGGCYYLALAIPVALLLAGGCPSATDGTGGTSQVFNNTTDPTNDGAGYIGSVACSACHPDVAAKHRAHGHSHALKGIQGQAPEYAPEGTRAGVPNPPAGMSWNDISYVISGYLHGAFFVDRDGFVATDGVTGVNTQWNLDFPLNGTVAAFVAYLPGQTSPKPYDYETCFRCHTTGPQPQDANDPRSQDGRPGILGTWVEPAVQCEACHGPGSNHAPDPAARDIFVDSTPQTCGRCHTGGDDPDVITAADGFLRGNTQYTQLLASGGHSGFNCTVCHDPHASITYDRDQGLRNDCTACHADQNMARHAGKIFVRGNYVEALSCESCHMPFAGLSASAAGTDIAGNSGRMGDTRTHIFRISTENVDFSGIFTAEGSAVVKDTQNRAAVTVDFVCLRCHTDESAISTNAVSLNVRSASALAAILHEMPQ